MQRSATVRMKDISLIGKISSPILLPLKSMAKLPITSIGIGSGPYGSYYMIDKALYKMMNTFSSSFLSNPIDLTAQRKTGRARRELSI